MSARAAERRTRIVHITTVPMTLAFLRGQAGFLREHGFEMHAVSSPGPGLDAFGQNEGVPVHGVPMTRRMTPFKDLVSLFRLTRLLHRLRPDIVHVHTPKASLLGLMASAALRVPVRIYHLRGLPLAGAKGPARTILRATETLSCALAHRVFSVSQGLRQTLIDAQICRADKVSVLGAGSGQGVDAAGRFHPGRSDLPSRAEIHQELGLPAGATVIGFVGRLVREKGVEELAAAWSDLRARLPNLWLLLVGPFEAPGEGRDALSPSVRTALEADPRVLAVGEDWNTPRLYRAMDVVAFPSWREGFPNVPLEAAAMALPVVATDIPGCDEAVVHGETGTRVPPRDPPALADALLRYLQDPDLRERHGQAGRARALRDFAPRTLWSAMVDAYVRPHPSTLRDRVKRGIDLCGSGLGLVVLSPLLALLALGVRFTLGSPVLFRQERAGHGGQLFRLYKFRTMRDAHDARGRPLPDGARLTRFGRFLRASSLDELPELWNVLRGEMSLVGPRPLLPEYLPLYTPEQARRHEVRPGMTGWAQIHGRNAVGWEDRFRLDVWYVDHRRTGLDLRILARTLVHWVRPRGISHPGHATMERFRGGEVSGT